LSPQLILNFKTRWNDVIGSRARLLFKTGARNHQR
jgi:hypothetical protein